LNPNHTFIKLNLEYFIAKRLINAKDYKSSISAPIIKLRSAIAIGMIMMIVSVATGIGLQQKIREKFLPSMGISFLIMIISPKLP
jgi:lipoprotein-releasing system permease protein